MSKSENPAWCWQALTCEEIQANLLKAKGKIIDYGDSNESIMGFPGTTPHSAGVDAFKMFIDSHPNNICTHTSGESEDGFTGTQELEKIAIFMMAKMLGVDNPDGNIDGYLTSGGTEANIMGIYLGREYLQRLNPDNPDVAIITSFLSHYSIRKAAVMLGLEQDNWTECSKCSISHIFKPSHQEKGLHFVGTDRAGRIDGNQVENKIRSLYRLGTRNFIIALTEGTTLTGAVDRVCSVVSKLNHLKTVLRDINFYIHVDACFGGFIVPFLNFNQPTSFKVAGVDSIAIDPHKMGLVPYPAGSFIYRRDDRKFKDHLGVMMGYVPGYSDATLCGSRTGAAAAACYATFKTLGSKGYFQFTRDRMQMTYYFTEKISSIPDIETIKNDLNIVGFRVKGGRELSRDFTQRHKIHNSEFPIDLSNPHGCVSKIYAIVIMHHVTRKMIDNFIQDLKHELS